MISSPATCNIIQFNYYKNKLSQKAWSIELLIWTSHVLAKSNVDLRQAGAQVGGTG